MKDQDNQIVPGAEFNRLMSVAVVSQQFREQLLTKPSEAIAAGYQGEKFNFSPRELKLLLSIKVTTLEEFAEQLLARLQTKLKNTIKQH